MDEMWPGDGFEEVAPQTDAEGLAELVHVHGVGWVLDTFEVAQLQEYLMDAYGWSYEMDVPGCLYTMEMEGYPPALTQLLRDNQLQPWLTPNYHPG